MDAVRSLEHGVIHVISYNPSLGFPTRHVFTLLISSVIHPTLSVMFSKSFYRPELKDGSVADDVDGWSPGLRTPLSRNLSPAFPRRALEHLSERQLFPVEVEPLSETICDAISGNIEM